MTTKAKAVKHDASAMLHEAAQAGATAWQKTLEAMRMRVTEKGALDGAVTGTEKQKALTAWARKALADTPNSFGTISGYIRKSASIALVPNAVGKVLDGVGDKAARRDVAANEIKTRRELSAVAEAANAKLGIKKAAGSGKAKPQETPEQKAETQAALAIENAVKNAKANEKLAQDADKGASQTIVALIAKAFDGQHPHMRQAIIDGLSHVGFILAPKTLVTAAQEKAAKAESKAQRKRRDGTMVPARA